MRILQLIDSLEAGGAEKMAVSYANALHQKVDLSALISTRIQGPLLYEIHKDVKYCHLDRKSLIDLKAIYKLYRFCNLHKVDLIHAHSTSYFLAVLIKILRPSTKIIWHNHNGMIYTFSKFKVIALKIGSKFFSGTIVVNKLLMKFSTEVLKSHNCIYLPNFPVPSIDNNSFPLKGKDGYRIVCVANLRVEKNHHLLLEIALEIIKNHRDWSLHLIGKDFNDNYSDNLKKFITVNDLTDTVFLYGTCTNVPAILRKCEIAALVSDIEGLPVALLEYGEAALPVVVTAVGEMDTIVVNNENGLVIQPNDNNALYDALETYMLNDAYRKKMGQNLKSTINDNYSQKVTISRYLNWLKL